MDFARMIEVFEKHTISFVWAARQFNTTNSLGRLKLNILLSLAQFSSTSVVIMTPQYQARLGPVHSWDEFQSRLVHAGTRIFENDKGLGISRKSHSDRDVSPKLLELGELRPDCPSLLFETTAFSDGRHNRTGVFRRQGKWTPRTGISWDP